MTFTSLLTAGLLLVPQSDSGLGSFARDFRVFCLGGDPTTGGVPVAAVLTILSSPLLMGGFITLVWARPLAALRGRGLRPFVLPAALGLAASATVAAGMFLTNPPQAASVEDLPFPATEIRTSFRPPEFELINHLGEKVSSDDFLGRVTVLTSVYAHCPAACPMIFAQAKRVVASLSPAQQEAFSFVAVTMDPERDTPEVLAELAQAQGLPSPTWQLLTGEPAHVEDVLDRMDLKRSRDPETGLIDHANLFLVIDREGRVAYTFALGDLQEKWLIEALHLLVAEGPPAA
jgi:cytochrome oxidase Cu insertion factor (SCO1/SenC/PrrC family)